MYRVCQHFVEKLTSKSRRARAKAPTSSFREKMQEIISDFLLVSSSKYMEPLRLYNRGFKVEIEMQPFLYVSGARQPVLTLNQLPEV